MRSLIVAAVLGAAVSAGGTASAQPASQPPGSGAPAVRRVAIVAVKLAGDAAPQLRRPIARNLAEGLAAAGLEVVSLDEATRLMAPNAELSGCTSTECLEKIGELCGADHLLSARVEARGADYTIALELVASGGGGGVRTLSATCAICTVGDLGRRTARAAGEVVTASAALDAVILASSPEGATIFVDGVPAGRAPVETRLARGRHTVRAELDGRIASQSVVEVEAATGEIQRFELILAPAVAGSGRRFDGWKWLAAGGGLVGFGVGMTLIMMDGGGTCDEAGECQRVYDTAMAGWLSVAVGVGLGGAAGWMHHRDRQDERAPRLTATPRSVSLGFAF